MQLNQVYDVKYAGEKEARGPLTLLDNAYALQESISPKRKTLDALAKKHAGGLLGKRRRFIAEVIALLERRGAKRAVELR